MSYGAGGRLTVERSIASSRVSTVLPLGSRFRMSLSRPSSSSVVKPWTSDQARAIAAAVFQRQRLVGHLLLTADADRAGQASERRTGGLVQRGPRHIEPLGAEHQPVHAGMRLRIGDIGLGPRHRLHERRRIDGAGRRHRDVELPEADRGEFADEAGEIAEMMGGCGMRHAGLARHRAQRQAAKTVPLQHGLGGLEQGVVQVAVMIRRGFAGLGACEARLVCGRPGPAPRLSESRRTAVRPMLGVLAIGAI